MIGWLTLGLLMLAGYALQGRPGLAGTSVTPASKARDVDPGLSLLRASMFGRFTVAENIFVTGDALIRSGNPQSAVALYLGAVNAQAQNAALWTGLGSAYADQDGGVSPASRFAFDRAMKLAPEHPGPPFFLGLALGYRTDIGDRLALLDQFLASEAGRSAR